MEREDALKRIYESGVAFDVAQIELWANLYEDRLIDELYAVRKAITVLAWLKAKKDFSLCLDGETIRRASDILVNMACTRHSFDCDEGDERDYNQLFKNTEKDFFGGLYIKDLVCTLDTLASLMNDDQDPQE